MTVAKDMVGNIIFPGDIIDVYQAPDENGGYPPEKKYMNVRVIRLNALMDSAFISVAQHSPSCVRSIVNTNRILVLSNEERFKRKLRGDDKPRKL